jgi:hypothetical protein
MQQNNTHRMSEGERFSRFLNSRTLALAVAIRQRGSRRTNPTKVPAMRGAREAGVVL